MSKARRLPLHVLPTALGHIHAFVIVSIVARGDMMKLAVGTFRFGMQSRP